MVAETWLRKLDLNEFLDISLDHFRGESVYWDIENNEIISHTIEFIYDGVDYQQNCNVWINNIEGHFYSKLCETSGGTLIVRKGDKYKVRFFPIKIRC